MQKRSAVPFFEEEETKAAIGEVAQSSRLVVYAGAGLTIDRSQHSWEALIRALLQHAGTDTRTVELLFGLYSSEQVASIAFAKLKSTMPEHWEGEIVNILNSLLYQSSSWIAGKAAENLARLALSFAALDRRLTVLTTNYDTFYEEELLRFKSNPAIAMLATLDPDDPTPDASDLTEAGTLGSENFDIVYLHGMIPDQALLKDRPASIVLSESQYLETADAVHSHLSSQIQDGTLLIYGSGLTDRPLLRALNEAAPSQRFAIVPNPGLKASYGPEMSAIQEAVRERMSQFGVRTVFPDHYGQAAQMLTEIRICAEQREEHGPYNDERCSYNYGARLSSWWAKWYGDKQGAMPGKQLHDHEHLRDFLPTVREALGAPEHLKLKAQLWVRWKPSTHERDLRLWATSSGTWSDISTMRSNPIESGSEMLAVQALCAGRPLLGPVLETDRWTRYLAVPLMFQQEFGPVPVGVLTIAIMPGDKQNLAAKLSEANNIGLNKLVAEMAIRGAELVRVADEPS